VYLSIKFHCTQLVPLTRSNTYRNVASRLLAGLVTVEQARTTASFAREKNEMRGIELRGNAPRGNDLRVIVTQPSGRVSAPNPAGGGGLTAHSALPDFLAGGKGLLPLPKKPTPALGLRSCLPTQ